MKCYKYLVLAGTAITPCMSPAYAQDAAPSSSGELQEIIVTAQRRAENAQDVPISISTVSADALDAAGVRSTTELNMVVPSVSFNQNSGALQTYVRGIGTSISSGGNESSVATYVDGVYYASVAGTVLSLNNISQIAVLKGPQGTLFGRNATGGVIQVTTREPTQQFQGELSATYGNYDTYGGNAYLTGGITAGLAADIAVQYINQSKGFGRNLFNGKEVNKHRDISLRSKWKAELTPDTTGTLIFDYQDSEQVGPAGRPTSPTPLGPFVGGEYDQNTNIEPRLNVRQYGASLHLRHDMGPVALVSISAYRRTRFISIFDSDYLPIDRLSVDSRQYDEQFSQELQLLSTSSGPLKWVAGLYYFDASGSTDPALVGGPISNVLLEFRTNQKTRSLAGFGQATYAFNERTSLTAGLRMTMDTKSIRGSGSTTIPVPGIVIPRGPYDDETTLYKPTWRLSIDHKFNDDIMAYASYNRGFKSGGYDPVQNAVARKFQPEILDAYEIGLKSELLDRRLRLNVAGFYYDFKNPQLNTFVNSLPAVYNGKSAKIYGVDLDLTAVPVDGLTLTGGLSALHGRYGDFLTPQTAVTPNGVIVLPDASAEGNMLQNTPSFQIKAGATYRHRLANRNTLNLTVNYSYQTKMYAVPENRLVQPAYSLVNASLTWASDEEGRFTAQIWGRNLGNTAYFTQFGTAQGITDFAWLAPPRTYGVTLGTKF